MKEIIKIRAEIKEQEMKKIVANINETKSWFFQKTKFINLQLDSSRKKGRGLKSIKLEMKKEALQQKPQKHKDHKRLIQAIICQ